MYEGSVYLNHCTFGIGCPSLLIIIIKPDTYGNPAVK